MPKLTYHCPICEKELVLVKEVQMNGGIILNSYRCGHMFLKTAKVIEKSTLDFTSVDGSGKVGRDYQKAGVEFILESNFNTIVADQMRLGKTPQSLLALKNAYKERTPCLILVKSANLWQWIREYKVWCDALPNGIFPIVGTQAWIPLGFSAYIISMDTFSRPKMLEQLKKIPFKLIIADEAHSYKNTTSNRSQALTDFITFLNTGEDTYTLHFTCSRCQNEWDEQGKRTYDKRIGHTVLSKQSKCEKCGTWVYQQQQKKEDRKDPSKAPCGVILLTGTPIINRAEEYFVPLNIVDPEKFSSLERFRRQWIEQDSRGRWMRVKPHLLETFKATIKPYFIRREKEDVYTDLPVINRTFTVMQPEKDGIAQEYNKILDKLEEKLAGKVNPNFWDMKDDFNSLRRLCGLMKVMWVADYLDTCLNETDEKYAIGIHHKDVRDILFHKLGGAQNCFKLSGEDNAETKDRIMREFEYSKQRILIINMEAGGVGMDFHYCNNVLVLERAWSSTREEQFEFRFYNPDKSIKQASTNIEYILARGTIDSPMYDMNEEKREVFGETVANHWDYTSNPSSFAELLQRTLGARL